MIECPRCERPNGSKRRYCGGCGLFIAPACQACEYASNDVDDKFCGGCGGDLVGPSATSFASGPVDELRDLFAPVEVAGAGRVELPESGVSQDDVDRLFGPVGGPS